MQARYYDPVLGRFLSNDPVGFVDSGFNPQMFGRYTYTWNDPINMNDPTGQIPIDTIADVGFLAFDVLALGYDEAFNGGANRGENLAALGADALGVVTPYATGLGVATGIGHNTNRLSRPLRNKLKRINNSLAAGGNRTIAGSVTTSDAFKLGEKFVGEGFTSTTSKKGVTILRSKGGKRQFRGPSAKNGPHSKTGTQVNFESRASTKGDFENNVHLDVGDSTKFLTCRASRIDGGC